MTRLIHLIGRERRIVVLVRKGPGAGDTPRLSLSLFSVSRLFTTLARFFYPFPISIRENRAKKALKQRNTQKLQSGVNKFHYFAKGTFSSPKLSDYFARKKPKFLAQIQFLLANNLGNKVVTNRKIHHSLRVSVFAGNFRDFYRFEEKFKSRRFYSK